MIIFFELNTESNMIKYNGAKNIIHRIMLEGTMAC